MTTWSSCSEADTDTLLMLRLRSGDQESFARLVQRNRGVVVGHLTRIVQNEAIAEELSQDVFIRVYRARTAYEAKAKFGTWLFQITANVARNHFRDEKKRSTTWSLDADEGIPIRQAITDDAISVEERLIREAAGKRVRSAIGTLPPRQRAVVRLHRFEEMDYAAIGHRLGCSTLAVKSLMFRACETLRERLANPALS